MEAGIDNGIQPRQTEHAFLLTTENSKLRTVLNTQFRTKRHRIRRKSSFDFQFPVHSFPLTSYSVRKLANLSTYLLLPVLCKEAVNEGCIQLPCAKVGVSQDLPMQRNRGVDTFNNEHFQRSGHARNRF